MSRDHREIGTRQVIEVLEGVEASIVCTCPASPVVGKSTLVFFRQNGPSVQMRLTPALLHSCLASREGHMGIPLSCPSWSMLAWTLDPSQANETQLWDFGGWKSREKGAECSLVLLSQQEMQA